VKREQSKGRAEHKWLQSGYKAMEGNGLERLTVMEHENGDPMKLGKPRQEEERSDDDDDENKTWKKK
jgi:hypothetical protein